MIGLNKFSKVNLAHVDPILGMSVAYKKDPSENKVDMGIGAYRTNEGLPLIFSSVKEAERRVIEDPLMDKEYLPIDGLQSFNKLARDLILGPDCSATAENRVVSIQTISGTGSLRVGFESLKALINPPCAYVSSPTWPNHISIFETVGIPVKFYPYWNKETRGFDLEGMISQLNEAPSGSVVVLHACAHNPTGVDPTRAQ